MHLTQKTLNMIFKIKKEIDTVKLTQILTEWEKDIQEDQRKKCADAFYKMFHERKNNENSF